MKKTLLLALTLAGTAASLAGCSSGTSRAARLLEKKTYDVYANSPDYVDAEAEILYFKERPDVGYISFEEGMRLYKILRANYYNDATWEYTVSSTGKTGKLVTTVANPDNGATFVADTGNNTLFLSSMDDFLVEKGNIAGTPASSYGTLETEGSTSIDLIAWAADTGNYLTHFTEKESDGTLFELSDYDISLYDYDGTSYLPFATYNDFFLGPNYTPLSILKNGIYGVTSTSAMANVIKGQGLDITDDLLKFNYDETCLNLDYFHGFSEETTGRDFDTYFRKNGLRDKFLESAKGQDEALSTVINTLLDDGHTNFLAASPSNTEGITVRRGSRGSSYSTYYTAYANLRTAAYPSGVPGYQEIGSTAVITFDSFTEEPRNIYRTGVPTTLEQASGDAISLFLYAYSRITRENSPITNIVVDESINGGGDAKCADFLGAMLCGGTVNLYTRNPLTGTKTAARIVADCNLDGKYDDDDKKLLDIPTYVLTSPCSFSCGNFLPSLIKQKALGYTAGKRSGGGSNIVAMCSSAIGTAYRMSGNIQLCRISNGKFVHIDDGIEVDIPVANEHMYSNDRAELLADLKLA